MNEKKVADTDTLALRFKQCFHRSPTLWARAPGRVNLIGEHTDYNEGYVFPIAIKHSVWVVASPRSDRLVRMFSENFKEWDDFGLDDIRPNPQHPWSNYPRGVAHFLQQSGYHLQGADLLVYGDVPLGAGLSSSAAIEVAFALAFKALNDLPIKDVPLAQLCQKAENEFVGMRCGIMDQFVAIMGQENHALFLDTRSLHYEHIPWQNPNICLAIMDTKVKRELVSSAYNQRREECEQAVRLFQTWEPQVQSLRDVSPETFHRHKEELPEPIRQRAEHVIFENQRVLQSVEALRKGDYQTFGQLMRASHASLRDLYEVSCRELDLVVQIAEETPGVLGARMTGAGFGGCAIALLPRQTVSELTQRLLFHYTRQTQRKPDIYITSPNQGGQVSYY